MREERKKKSDVQVTWVRLAILVGFADLCETLLWFRGRTGILACLFLLVIAVE